MAISENTEPASDIDYAFAIKQLLQPLVGKMKSAAKSVCGKTVQASARIPEDLRHFNEVVAQFMAYVDGMHDLLQRLVKVVADIADTVEQQLITQVSGARKEVQALCKHAKRRRRKEDDEEMTDQIRNVLLTIGVTQIDSKGVPITLLVQIHAHWKEVHEILDAAAAMLGGKLPCLDSQIGETVKAHLGKFKGAMRAVLGDVKEQAMEALHELTNEVVENVTEAAGEAVDSMKEVGGLLGALGAGFNDMVQERAAQKAKWCAKPCVST